jgi:hypothetical protein
MAGLIETSQVGKREDLSDLIANVDQKTTPLLSRIRNGDAPGNTLMQWQVDDYGSVSTNGFYDSTDTTTFNDYSNRKVLKNHIQIFERSPQVSRLAERVSTVAGMGKRKEMAKQVAKALILQKRDIEASFCSRNVAKQEVAGTTPYKSRGLRSYIIPTYTGGSAGNATTSPTPGYGDDAAIDAAYLPAAAQVDTGVTTLTDDTVRGVMEAIWNNTGSGNNFLGLCGSEIKKGISDLVTFVQGTSTNVQVNADMGANKVTQIVDIIDTDFGIVELALSQFLDVQDITNDSVANPVANSKLVYFLDMDRIEARWESRPSFKSFEDKGGGPRGLISSVASLVLHNPLGFGLIELA